LYHIAYIGTICSTVLHIIGNICTVLHILVLFVPYCFHRMRTVCGSYCCYYLYDIAYIGTICTVLHIVAIICTVLHILVLFVPYCVYWYYLYRIAYIGTICTVLHIIGTLPCLVRQPYLQKVHSEIKDKNEFRLWQQFISMAQVYF